MSLADALNPHALADHTRYRSPKPEDVHMRSLHHLHPDTAEDDKDALNDLFGADEDVDARSADTDQRSPTPASEPADAAEDLSAAERQQREALEYAEDDVPEPPVAQLVEASAAMPNIPIPRSSDGNFWVMRMPNFIKLDSKPFHPDTYIGPEHEEEEAYTAEALREKSMSIKLKVENTVRWRWVKDEFGSDRRQSNSRIVRWSDGSLSLQLGKEIFDVTQSIDTSGAAGARGPLAASQSQSQSLLGPPAHTAGSGLTYLVAQHKRAEILQCEALVTGYLGIRPTGMQSETHRMLVRAVGQKHNRVARLRMTEAQREVKESDKGARRPRKSRATGEDDVPRPRAGRASRRRSGDDVWSSDEEDGDGAYGNGGDDDEGGGKRKKGADDRKGPGEYQTDDFVVADEDEDDDGGERRKRKRRGRDADEDDDEDDLEKLEAKISQQEAEERKRRPKGGGDDDGDGDDAMDVESEEEEDDDDVGRRRPRSGPGKKRRLVGPDEDDEDE